MGILSMIGLVLTAAAIGVVLRQYRPEFALLFSVAMGIFVLFEVFASMTPLMEQMREMFEVAGIQAEYVSILLKALATCFLTQIACDICRDSGEGAMASKLEMAGKVVVLGISLPLFRQVLAIVYSLIGQGGSGM